MALAKWNLELEAFVKLRKWTQLEKCELATVVLVLRETMFSYITFGASSAYRTNIFLSLSLSWEDLLTMEKKIICLFDTAPLILVFGIYCVPNKNYWKFQLLDAITLTCQAHVTSTKINKPDRCHTMGNTTDIIFYSTRKY
jgi:hypothetical protein